MRTFEVMDPTGELGVVVGREGDIAVPRCGIVGLGLFYKPPIVYGS